MISTRLLALAALCTSVVACAAEPAVDLPSLEAAAEGLVVQQDPVRPNRLVGTFRRGAHVLRFETVRGALNPGDDPGAPLHAVDVRIADEHGQVFFLQAGGDTFQDPSWEQDLEAPLDEAARAEAWALVEGLSAALAEPAPRKQMQAFASEVRALDGVARIAVHRAVVDANAIDVTPEELRAQATYYHYFRIYEGNIAGGLGEHSATLAEVRSSGGSLLNQTVRCNHGRCPSDSSMSYSCGRSLSSTSGSMRTMQSCGTTYDWNSNAGHNCHDDSRLQNRSWYNNTTYGTTGTTYKNYCSTNNSTYDTIYSPKCYP